MVLFNSLATKNQWSNLIQQQGPNFPLTINIKKKKRVAGRQIGEKKGKKTQMRAPTNDLTSSGVGSSRSRCY